MEEEFLISGNLPFEPRSEWNVMKDVTEQSGRSTDNKLPRERKLNGTNGRKAPSA